MKFRFAYFFLLLFGLTAALLTACKDKETPTPDYTAQDDATIQQYIKDKNLTGFTKDTSGVYVSITQPGTGPNAVRKQVVKALYTGTLLDGTVFDSNLTTLGLPFVLGQERVIMGWDKGFQYFNKGAKGILLVPSKLAYGSNATGKIPANAILRFDVEVVDIK
ncbi:FKBP-type peptidyl-prolyl cis-trans isomerase [Hymenobacter pini]|uniref:FKBP-type peptidyl-prolyl cis-trans isomerase n=1 Tax=Hymenobacter pini TaxID=2880879 RepID=UPI001CF2788E|nr:FKBP-type peptidyl-prolyl cis-trans isomerase [Hymenobacter pini]MCA8832807.1 FKBP-type peptidyl-prolyl cis-trans isomerase [Hymenobacter pini]